MRVTPDVTIGVLATALQKEIDEKTTFLAMLKAVMAQGVSPSTPYGAGGGGSVVPITSGKRRRGKKPTIAAASLEILRAAGRPLHGLREILPAGRSNEPLRAPSPSEEVRQAQAEHTRPPPLSSLLSGTEGTVAGNPTVEDGFWLRPRRSTKPPRGHLLTNRGLPLWAKNTREMAANRATSRSRSRRVRNPGASDGPGSDASEQEVSRGAAAIMGWRPC
jgi:hypothetical protein